MNTPISIAHEVVAGALPGKHLLITAGVHGDEFEGMQAIRRLIATLSAQDLSGEVTLAPVVNEAACHGCGLCAAVCPSGAADQRHFSGRQVRLELEGVLFG